MFGAVLDGSAVVVGDRPTLEALFMRPTL